jgi:hypothetical protein
MRGNHRDVFVQRHTQLSGIAGQPSLCCNGAESRRSNSILRV